MKEFRRVLGSALSVRSNTIQGYHHLIPFHETHIDNCIYASWERLIWVNRAMLLIA